MWGSLLCLTVYQEFDHLLEEQSPIESYIEWLDTMVDRCVVKVGNPEWREKPGYCDPPSTFVALGR